MKKYIVLSVNDNVDYLYFTPLTCWAWRKFGWEPIVFYHGEKRSLANWVFLGTGGYPAVTDYKIVNAIDGYRSDTITQISRLYGACVVDDGYLMTSDIDMIPLSDYWKPDFNRITVYGHDLTGFNNFPICYIGMDMYKWRDVMSLKSLGMILRGTISHDHYIKRDLDSLPQAKSPDFYTYWETDQDLITKRLKEYGTSKIEFINRGQGRHGFARGRVDKGDGGWVLDQPELIDCHMQQQTHHSDEKIKRLMDLLHHVWPKEDWNWFVKYTEEFKRLAV